MAASTGAGADLIDTLRVELTTELDGDTGHGAYPPGAVDYYARFIADTGPEQNDSHEPDAAADSRSRGENTDDADADADDESTVVVGHGHFVIADLHEPQLLDTLDARDGDLGLLGQTVCPLSETEHETLADGLDDIVDYIGGHAVLINHVEILEPFRGASLGLHATAITLKELRRGCSFAALHPMAPGSVNEAERFTSAAALTTYWARLAFRPWHDQTMVLPFALVDFDAAAARLAIHPLP